MIDYHILDKMKQKNPLVHNITNKVVANFVANGLLSIGASPFMSDDSKEMKDVALIADTLSVNLGTLNKEQIKAIKKACKAYEKLHKPILLDPVGAGATKLRKDISISLAQKFNFTCIRANAGEMAALAKIKWNSKGVDAGSGKGDLAYMAKKVAQKYHCIAVLTSKVDYISDGKKTFAIHGGSEFLPLLTGSGCLHGALCSAFLTLSEDKLSSLILACAFYSTAAKIAEEKTNQSKGSCGMFLPFFIDALKQTKANQIEKYTSIKQIS